ncbi:30S ribosomal protein S7 [bacterium]|nr:MAG: 30S ribosomal protein S7 [bacterium]QQR62049.1 MAG: 30S ribosomal protein S7 [bacterium]QQR62356.1 MAG: 30S ribosomal protein S7 [bacterium]
MPRRRNKEFVRDVGVDERFSSSLVQKLINVVMKCGKKSIARRIVYDAMDLVGKKISGDDQKILQAFEKAFDQIVPHVEVRSRRVGGGVYQVPVEVNPKRQKSLALRWLVQAAQERSDKVMGLRLGHEILDVLEGRGGALKKRTEVQRMAEANRAFSHYAW